MSKQMGKGEAHPSTALWPQPLRAPQAGWPPKAECFQGHTRLHPTLLPQVVKTSKAAGPTAPGQEDWSPHSQLSLVSFSPAPLRRQLPLHGSQGGVGGGGVGLNRLSPVLPLNGDLYAPRLPGPPQ